MPLAGVDEGGRGGSLDSARLCVYVCVCVCVCVSVLEIHNCGVFVLLFYSLCHSLPLYVSGYFPGGVSVMGSQPKRSAEWLCTERQ